MAGLPTSNNRSDTYGSRDSSSCKRSCASTTAQHQQHGPKHFAAAVISSPSNPVRSGVLLTGLHVRLRTPAVLLSAVGALLAVWALLALQHSHYQVCVGIASSVRMMAMNANPPLYVRDIAQAVMSVSAALQHTACPCTRLK